MLILTRRIGETLCIGDDITVTVLGVQGMQVRLGINAPKSVAVDREEIAARKAAEPRQAKSAPSDGDVLYANRAEQEWRDLLAAEEAARLSTPSAEGGHHVSN